MSSMTPREIVHELNQHIIGQDQAKRSVAIALRNRWRRMQLPEDMRAEVTPKNILMIGPTGVGKTEIARRLAKLAKAPFIKVEATKFTEVGYVGRDVESVIRDLVDAASKLIREEEMKKGKHKAADAAEERILDVLLPPARNFNDEAEASAKDSTTRQLFRKKLREGELDEKDIEIEVADAKIENIQRVSEDFSQTKTVRLEQNYRSTSNILKAANAVICNNTGRLGKDLWTEGESGELIDLYAAFNEHDEARFAVDKIESLLLNDNLRKDDIAMLYRSNAQSRVLEESLIRSAIPYRIYGGQRFYERLEIKHALAYVRLIANRHDDTAFERVLNIPPRGIGNKSVEVLRSVARDEGCHLFEAVGYINQHKLLPARAVTALTAFLDLLESMDQSSHNSELENLIDMTIEQSGLVPFFKKEKGEKAQARLDNLAELVTAAREFNASDSDDSSPLQQFLDNAALDAGDSQADEFEDSVQLMTLHSAKGLEFSHVFLLGLEENLFPHKMSMDEPGRLEEERRLCYVGITRAMQRLFISYAESRRLYGTENYQRPSRFLKEIPAELVQEIRLNAQVSRPVTSSAYKKPEPIDVPVQLGGRVMHPKFGEGVVLQYEGSGSSTRIQVNFAEAGSKWLVLQFAPLEVL